MQNRIVADYENIHRIEATGHRLKVLEPRPMSSSGGEENVKPVEESPVEEKTRPKDEGSIVLVRPYCFLEYAQLD